MGMSPNEGEPAQGNRGYPPPPPPSRGASSVAGFNLQELAQRWQAVVRNPTIATFDAQLASASWQTVLIGLTVLGLVGAVFGYIAALELGTSGGGTPIGDFVLAFIGFFLMAGILHVVARMFGGVSPFLQYAYVLSLVAVPLGMASAVAGIIPALHGLLQLLVGLYEIYVLVLATAAAHRLTLGKAAAVVLIPLAIVFALLALLVVLLGAALLAAFATG
jgi:hypothetical protein